jgi:hypothetical protein
LDADLLALAFALKFLLAVELAVALLTLDELLVLVELLEAL